MTAADQAFAAAIPTSLAIVLAAGKGTRMKSDLPKVLIPIAGRPMIDYVIDALEAGGVDRQVIVIGYRGDLVRTALASRRNVRFVEQTQQLGTGHAVQVCREELAQHDGPVLIVTGDSPLVRPESFRALLAEFDRRRPACLLGTARKDNPTAFGRIVRDAQGNFQAIVEERDATPAQRQIQEVNLSCYVFDCRALLWALERLSNHNSQGEYYLTDCPGLLLRVGQPVQALCVLEPVEALSINTPEELALVEAEVLRRK